MGGASDPADDHCVKEDAQLLLLLLHFIGPVGEAETAKTMVGRTGRDGVRYAATCADLLQRVLPALLETNPEPCLDELDLGAHDARKQDVANPIVDRIRPVHPALLHQ